MFFLKVTSNGVNLKFYAREHQERLEMIWRDQERSGGINNDQKQSMTIRTPEFQVPQQGLYFTFHDHLYFEVKSCYHQYFYEANLMLTKFFF